MSIDTTHKYKYKHNNNHNSHRVSLLSSLDMENQNKELGSDQTDDSKVTIGNSTNSSSSSLSNSDSCTKKKKVVPEILVFKVLDNDDDDEEEVFEEVSGSQQQQQQQSHHNSSSNIMSATSVQTNTENLSRTGSNISLSCHSLCSSLDDSLGSHPQYQDTIVTIEELRAQLNSCFTCGVSWSEEHVSLDCSECGGYSLTRPCPLCDGRCHTTWKRDLTMSHASGKARWIGECGLSCGPQQKDESSLVPALEKLRATS